MKKLQMSVIFGLALSLSPLAMANGAAEAKERANKAWNELVEVVAAARLKPYADNPSALKQTEVDALIISNAQFGSFIETDCRNQGYAGGSNGGSALSEDVANCRTQKIEARIAELKKRYKL